MKYVIGILGVLALLITGKFLIQNPDHYSGFNTQVDVKSGVDQKIVTPEIYQESEDHLIVLDQSISDFRAAMVRSISRFKNSDAILSSGVLDLDPEELARAYLEFNRERGYYLVTDNSDYNYYDIETLEKLATQGDMRAWEILTDKYMKEGLDGKKSYDAALEAAVLGSTSAFTRLAMSHQPNETEASENIATSKDLDVLSFYQAGFIRGDYSMVNHAEAYLHVRGLALTDAEKMTVHERGLSIYYYLNEQREHKGLDAFDDSLPAPVAVISALSLPETFTLEIPSNSGLEY